VSAYPRVVQAGTEAVKAHPGVAWAYFGVIETQPGVEEALDHLGVVEAHQILMPVCGGNNIYLHTWKLAKI
jgi:hypothetical protein